MESPRQSMLIGLSVLGFIAFLQRGRPKTLHHVLTVGGPFCNLFWLPVAQMAVEDFTKAIKIMRAHLPDPTDVEANLFLRDIQDFFVKNRLVWSSIQRVF